MKFQDIPKTYPDLVAMEPPRLIADRIHYDRVFSVVTTMVGHEMTDDQSDYLETLQMMVERWEGENCEIGRDDEGLQTG